MSAGSLITSEAFIVTRSTQQLRIIGETMSPTPRPVTPSPSAAMRPTASPPGMKGSGGRDVP